MKHIEKVALFNTLYSISQIIKAILFRTISARHCVINIGNFCVTKLQLEPEFTFVLSLFLMGKHFSLVIKTSFVLQPQYYNQRYMINHESSYQTFAFICSKI